MCQSRFQECIWSRCDFNNTIKVAMQMPSRFGGRTGNGLLSLVPETAKNAELWLLSTMYQPAPGTLWCMTFARSGSGCSRLIMEAQTVGLINSEGSTRSTCKSFCHAGALSREQLGRSSWNSWHLAPPQPLNRKQPGSHHGGLGRDERNIPQCLDIPLLSTHVTLHYNSQWSMEVYTFRGLNSNTTTRTKKR